MRYVQYLPPLVEPPPEEGEVKAIAHVAAPHRVTERTLPPMIYRHRTPAPAMPAINHRQFPRAQAMEGERRKVCRRVHDAPVPEELRSGTDRRRHNQRKSDLTTAIDEKA